MALFQKGREKTGGRAKGTRNKISESFLKDALAEWEVSGPDALKVMAKDDPAGFVKVFASLMPKEFEITDNRLAEFSDDELDEFANDLRRRIAERRAAISGGRIGENQTTH